MVSSLGGGAGSLRGVGLEQALLLLLVLAVVAVIVWKRA
jgi:hypothetical protein